MESTTEGNVLLCDALFFFKRERTNRSTGTKCGHESAYLPLSTNEVEGFDQERSAAIRRLCIRHQRRAVCDDAFGVAFHAQFREMQNILRPSQKLSVHSGFW